MSKDEISNDPRVPARCLGGHGLDSRWGSDFSLSHARVMLINSLFTFHYISLATQAQAQAQLKAQSENKI